MTRFAAALPLLALLALPSASHAKPSSKVPPTSSSAKATPAPSTSVSPTKKVARKHVDKLKIAKPLSIKAKTELLAKAGIAADAGDLGEPITVSVRDPRPIAGVHVTFVGLNMVLPQRDRGTAVVGQLNDMNNYDDVPPPETADSDIPEIPAYAIPCLPGLCFLTDAMQDAAAAAAAAAETQRGSSYVTLRFRAAPDKAYIVDCMASAEGELHAQTIVAKAIVDRESSTASGQFDLLVSRGQRRDIRIDLFAREAWTFRQCQITPVS